VPIPVLESGFIPILRAYRNLVIARLQVQFGKKLRTTQTLKEIVDPRKRVGVLDGLRIEFAIIDTKAKVFVLLSNKEDRRSVRRTTRPDPTLLQEVLELGPESDELILAHAINASPRWLGTGLQNDLMRDRPVGHNAGRGLEDVIELVE
jgi:hypothetical protein